MAAPCNGAGSEVAMFYTTCFNPFYFLLVINRFFMKLFKTNNIDIVKSCQLHFNFDIPSALWVKRVKRFNEKFSATNNTFCKITESSRVHVMFV